MNAIHARFPRGISVARIIQSLTRRCSPKWFFTTPHTLHGWSMVAILALGQDRAFSVESVSDWGNAMNFLSAPTTKSRETSRTWNYFRWTYRYSSPALSKSSRGRSVKSYNFIFSAPRALQSYPYVSLTSRNTLRAVRPSYTMF